MYLMRQIGTRGVYGDPVLPDFMVFLNWQELPWYWHGFDNFGFAALMVLVVPGLLAFVFGWFAFRSRVSASTCRSSPGADLRPDAGFFRNEMGFGGNNGLTDFKDVLGVPLHADGTRIVLFVLSALALAGGYLCAAGWSRPGWAGCWWRSATAGSRPLLGYRVERVKALVFTLSAMLAGVAGALYVPQVGIINPGEFAPLNSIEAVIWVAVGGRGTLVGAVIGAVLVNYAKTWLTGALPEVWLFALGGLFVAVTVLLPYGLIGLLRRREKAA